jgi:hypothetical protein
MYRNPVVAINGPLGPFQRRLGSASELLDLASPAALGQLAALREVFASTLLPQLANRLGRWVLGAEFTGSALIKADADVIAAGLLLDLKTDAKLSLGVTTVFQVIGYALLDFDDAYQLTEVGIFSARYAYLPTWDLGALLGELAGHHVNLPVVRHEFRQLLLAQLSADGGGYESQDPADVMVVAPAAAETATWRPGRRKGPWMGGIWEARTFQSFPEPRSTWFKLASDLYFGAKRLARGTAGHP